MMTIDKSSSNAIKPSVRRFGRALFGALVILAGLSGCQNTNNSSNRPDLAITNVTLIDTANGTRRQQTVIVDDGMIKAIQPANGQLLQVDRIIDGSGKFLIPGLWDMHVHITYEPEITKAMPELFLSYGITSVRDTGGLLPKLLPEITRWRAPGATAPRIFFSGPLLDGNNVVYNGVGNTEIGTANPSVASARANVRALKEAGADFIKIYELVTPDVFEALVAEARRLELPIAAHVPLMLRAREAGPLVDSMEHLRNIELDCSTNAEALLAERSRQISNPGDTPGYGLRSDIHATQRPKALATYNYQTCRETIESLRNTLQVPTLRLNTTALYQPFDREDWQAHVKRLPTTAHTRWLDAGRSFSRLRRTMNPANARFSLQLVNELHAANVPIAAGTDTPIGSALPGYSLHTELERLVEAGLSPAAALTSATVNPARFFGKADSMGSLARGYVADMVLLEADPLRNITNTRRIHTVISKGKIAWQSTWISRALN